MIVMKKFTTLGLILFTINVAIAQGCLPEGINFTTQGQIDNFQSNYPGCSSVEGSVSINGPGITNLLGLNVLTSVGGDLIIGNNPDLISLSGLENLTLVGNFLEIISCPLLQDLNALNSLITIGADLSLIFNPSINSITGLSNLISIGGNLLFDFNTALVNLNGLENVGQVGGSITISFNSELRNISGLRNIASMGGELLIEQNEKLTDISGLDNIEENSISKIVISGNMTLSDCAVWSVCKYLINTSGEVNIFNNAPGCNSPEEVIEACDEVSINKMPFIQELKIYPNPASDMVFIELPETGQSTSLTIYDISGQEVLFMQAVAKTQYVDLSGLKAGLYMVKVVGDNCSFIELFVKK